MAGEVFPSYYSRVHHAENSAVILCPLWGLCDLGMCMNLSGSVNHRIEMTPGSELYVTEERSLVSSTNSGRYC